jgi:hypothetical protein
VGAIPLLLGACSLDFPATAVVPTSAAFSRPAPARDPSSTVPVVLFADKLHTGLVLDLQWLRRHGYVPPADTREAAWAAFSWGDQVAYLQREWLSLGQAAHAMLRPTPSVMEIIAFDDHIPNVCQHQRLYLAHVPEAAGTRIAAFLNACAVRGREGRPDTLGPASWGRGRLIRSPYAYFFPRICNLWTVGALRVLGFRLSGVLGLPADGVILQASRADNGFRKIWDPAWRVAATPPPPPRDRFLRKDIAQSRRIRMNRGDEFSQSGGDGGQSVRVPSSPADPGRSRRRVASGAGDPARRSLLGRPRLGGDRDPARHS